MTTTLLIASGNIGKLREIEAILVPAFESAPLVRCILPRQIGLNLDVTEDGSTYAENAAKKALAYSQASGFFTLADDSGLEVDALNGQPGLYSARYAPWPGASDADRRQYLLENLRDIPRPWPAHFHCTVAVAAPDGGIFYAEGNCPGEIIPEERGANGFGYDPIFLLPELGLTMAEIPDDHKNTISHRTRALQAALPYLRQILGG